MPQVTQPVSVEKACVRDLEILVNLFQQYLNEYNDPALNKNPMALRSYLHNRLSDPKTHIYIAKLSGCPVGFALVTDWWSSLNFGKQIYVRNLFVLPEARKKGVAKTLMAHAEMQGRQEGYTRVTLRTAVDNDKARSLYEELGYNPVENLVTYEKSLSR